jgi:cell fate (sporulation/competence/biofilm development) regulator YlbF (YheA/YmcA/DUF963 family)
MNVYDQAHNLARALRESEEYKLLLQARRSLDTDAKNKEMLVNFRKLQWELEEQKALGKDVPEDKLHQMEQLGQLVSINPSLKNYLNAEFSFGRLMTDIQKILSDALSDWYEGAEDIIGKQD